MKELLKNCKPKFEKLMTNNEQQNICKGIIIDNIIFIANGIMKLIKEGAVFIFI